MSKILITGNGFDLFHHLPTKYQHFMSVMKTIENNQFDNDISFDELHNAVKPAFLIELKNGAPVKATIVNP